MGPGRLLYRLVVLPLIITFFPCFLMVHPVGGESKQSKILIGDKGEEEYRRALNLIKLGKVSEALPLLETAWRKNPDSPHMLADYLSALVWLGLYAKAINIYVAQKNKVKDIKYLYRNMAKAFYETGDYRQAQTLYGQAFSFDNADAEALKGLVFSSSKLEDYHKPFKAWLTAYQKKTISLHTLTVLRIYLIQQMGASSLAWQYAREAGIKDKELMESLKGDVAAERIKWEEYDVAIQILEEQLRDDPNNFRARCDYIVALRHKYRMKEVLIQYQILEKSGRPAPYWVTEAVADALLYLKRPKEAEKFYQIRLEQNPQVPFKAYVGLFNTSTELREWGKAEKAWDQIDDLLKKQKVNSMERHEALVARGWSFIYQDKLKEAQDYFEALLREAGLNPGFRSSLAYTYLYRGWPSKALEQFKIGRNVNPEDVSTQVGQALALDELNYKYAARNLAAELYRKYPNDLHVQNLYETLRIEDMHLAWGEARVTNEWPGATEYTFRGGATATVTPVLKIFSEVLHRHDSAKVNGEKFAFSWDRWGFGFNWILLPPLTITQSVSWDYLKGRDLGSYTKVAWQASDRLKATASFDSFSLDIPLRARVTGVKGKTALLDLGYHESDLRDYGLLFASNWLSDGNYNPSILLGFDQNVINNPDWKVRVGPQFYYARYSKDQNVVPYFSPNHEYSLVLKPSLQITHYEMYDKRIRSNIYTDFGLYKEIGFDFLPIAGITYEQEIRTSKTFWLKLTVGYNLRVYDGKYSNVLDAFFSINKKF